MKVHIGRANRIYCPDVIVCCEPLVPDADDYYETAPKVLANVDGDKGVNYQAMEALVPAGLQRS